MAAMATTVIKVRDVPRPLARTTSPAVAAKSFLSKPTLTVQVSSDISPPSTLEHCSRSKDIGDQISTCFANVEVLFDFCYETDCGRKVAMKQGEQLQLIKKTNKDWYQVQRVVECPSSKFEVGKKFIKVKPSNHKKNNSTGSIDVSSCEEIELEEDNAPNVQKASTALDESEDEDVENETLEQDDDLDCPFYAPSGYLKEWRADAATPSSRSNVMSGSFSCDDDQEDSGNAEDIEMSSNTAATSSRESLVDCEVSVISACDTSDLSSAKSVLVVASSKVTGSTEALDGIFDEEADYENVPTLAERSASRKPPCNSPLTSNSKSKPKPLPPIQGQSPVRILLDHWAEYVDSSGRRFYYNSVTRDSSFKPPRRRPSYIRSESETETGTAGNSIEDLTSYSQDNLECKLQSATADLVQRHVQLATCASLPCRPKSKPRKLVSEHLYRPAEPPTLTLGWTRHLDEDSKQIYYVNDTTKEKVSYETLGIWSRVTRVLRTSCLLVSC